MYDFKRPNYVPPTYKNTFVGTARFEKIKVTSLLLLFLLRFTVP
jgi:hypothetical protein